MLFYHGTTKRVAEVIKKEGLKPHRSSAYNVEVENWFGGRRKLRDMIGEDLDVLYLTPFKERAELYASFRARYEMAEDGQPIVFHPLVATQYKIGNSCGCKEEPTILVFDIPEDIERKFHSDIQDHSAAICQCEIPPDYIVDMLPANIHLWQEDQDDQF